VVSEVENRDSGIKDQTSKQCLVIVNKAKFEGNYLQLATGIPRALAPLAALAEK
jgi:hypothetical protein